MQRFVLFLSLQCGNNLTFFMMAINFLGLPGSCNHYQFYRCNAMLSLTTFRYWSCQNICFMSVILFLYRFFWWGQVSWTGRVVFFIICLWTFHACLSSLTLNTEARHLSFLNAWHVGMVFGCWINLVVYAYLF